MNRIESKFRQLSQQRRKAFIAFITAGYPDLKTTGGLVQALEEVGVDIIELGVPFTDPMADGPVIQESSHEALKKGVRLVDILSLVRSLRRQVRLPICLMTYYNPVFCFGQARFIRRAKACGVDGVIIPDLPPEEGKDFIKLANKSGLDNICFIAPTTSLKRMKFIAKVARGFIYYVSLTGVTGPRQKLPAELRNKLKVIKRHTKKPVCVGFGVACSRQVREISQIADGVIVGSAIIKKIKQNLGKRDLLRKVSNFVSALKK